ncbi:MAG: DUF1292 domain-containing protein [Clostridia bacterium]|nr:DUF1292 domain-containing protein [Clostridia bacterium]
MENKVSENELPAAITLIGEDGTRISFEHILTFMYENERYMALAPEGTEDDEEADVLFMKIVKAAGEDALEPVENEVLLDELFDAFCELMDEDGEEDEEEE